jgi:hypothetical protein
MERTQGVHLSTDETQGCISALMKRRRRRRRRRRRTRRNKKKEERRGRRRRRRIRKVRKRGLSDFLENN